MKKKSIASSAEKKVVRANPGHKKEKAASSGSSSEAFIKDVLFGGAAAVAFVSGGSMLINRFDMEREARGALLAAGGVFGGLWLSKKHRKAAMGMAIGGLAIGALEIFSGTRARAASAQLGSGSGPAALPRPGQDPWATLQARASQNAGSGTSGT